MKLLFFLGLVLGPPVLGAADPGGFDVGTMIASYGIAAPFAGLCLWQMQRLQKKLDASETKISDLQAQAVEREKEFATRLAPLLYDGALLYQRGNERLAAGLSSQEPADAEVRNLRKSVEELLRRMEENPR